MRLVLPPSLTGHIRNAITGQAMLDKTHARGLALRMEKRWLQGMLAPTLMLWLYMLALGIATIVSSNGRLPWRADYVSRAACSLVVTSWVMADARKRGRRFCYDYDGWVFFFWPVIVPVYLFQTRGWRAFRTLLCFVGLLLVAGLGALVADVIHYFAH